MSSTPDEAPPAELSSTHATMAILAAATGGLLGCVGGWLGFMRVSTEMYRSCPTGLEEVNRGALATNLGSIAVAVLAAATVASLWGLVQGVRRRSRRPAGVALLLGLVALVFGVAAALVQHTTMC